VHPAALWSARQTLIVMPRNLNTSQCCERHHQPAWLLFRTVAAIVYNPVSHLNLTIRSSTSDRLIAHASCSVQCQTSATCSWNTHAADGAQDVSEGLDNIPGWSPEWNQQVVAQCQLNTKHTA
jgi:hypothetical protein